MPTNNKSTQISGEQLHLTVNVGDQNKTGFLTIRRDAATEEIDFFSRLHAKD
jgi:hypothetical protein